VDCLAAVLRPFQQAAEAIKPVLRKSVEQARPIAAGESPYLRAAIESLNPSAIHRTTALLRVLEILVEPEIDERALLGVEQVIRLNRAQYRLYQQLDRSHRDPRESLPRRIADETQESGRDPRAAEPPREPVEDLFALGYQEWPESLPRACEPPPLRRGDSLLHEPAGRALLSRASSADDRARLARTLVERLASSLIGADERQRRLGAVPIPIDLGKALATMGYFPEEKDRLARFREEVVRVERENRRRSRSGT
jgi:hypothetical protein